MNYSSMIQLVSGSVGSEVRMKVSVIVTVHNAEKYIRECLDSVLSQTFSDIEILCMDGGSTDGSPQILKEYAKKDNRIRIVNDPNTSYGHKVNEGIRQAHGDYISVLESDDMYQPDMLERLYEIARKEKTDFVNANYLEFWEIEGRRYEMPVKMYPKQDYNHLLESGKHPEDMRQILRYWTGIFRKDFLVERKIWMNESPGASFQDMSFRFLTSALAQTSYHLDAPVYCYREDNPFSSVHDPKKAVIIADEFVFLKRELVKRNIRNADIWRHFYTWKYNDFCGNLIRFDGKARKVLLERCYQELDIDRGFLETNNIGEYSRSVRDLLEKSKLEFENDIETRYENLREQRKRRENLYQQLKNYEIVIFGCGAYGRNVLKYLYSVTGHICCLSDNKQELWNTMVEGHEILPPEEAVRRYADALYIVANKLYAKDIVKQLRRIGIKEDMIYVY